MGVGETSRSSFKERASKCCWCVGSDPKDPKIEFVRDIVRRGLVVSLFDCSMMLAYIVIISI